MELSNKFKQTKFKIIPDDWDSKDFYRIGQVIDGDRGVNYPGNNDFHNEGFCLFLTAKNVTKDGFQFEDCIFITKEKDSQLGQGKLKKWDIVLTTRGTVGNFAYFDDDVPYENIRINSGMVLLRRENREVEQEYLYEILKSQIIENQICRMIFGSAQPQLTVKIINKFQIPFPKNKIEQRAIATALSDMDALIASLDKLIAKKRLIKQAAMQQLLTGKTRLPGFSGDWVEKKLGDLCSSIVDGTHFTPKYLNHGIPFFSVENVTSNNFSVTKLISAKEHAILKKRCKLEKGDILFTRIGSLGETKLIDWEVDASIYVSLALLKPNNFISSDFLYCYTKSYFFRKDVEKRALVNAVPPKINTGDIGNIPIPYPSDPCEQISIASILSEMDAEITALEHRRDKTRLLKQGMMQELLTGRIRLL